MHKALLLFHTVRYLRLSQVIARFWFRMRNPEPDLNPAPPLRESPKWTKPITKPVCLNKPWHFSFLNEARQCQFPGDWNNGSLEKLWLYNLHYFDDLCCHGAADRKEWHGQYIQQWLQDNPPGHGNGWEPYPLSLRIVNWIKWSLAGNTIEGMYQSLAVQTRFLLKRLEYHLLGNHLFTNGKALIFAGLFFSGDEAERWLRKGMEIITGEVKEQVLADGGHFERSPMYHAIILEDLLDLINIIQSYNFTIPSSWTTTVKKMNDWLQGMSHPDDDIVLFNDAALGIAAKPQEIFVYSKRLHLPISKSSKASLHHFKETGYVVWRDKEIAAYLDVAPIGPDYLPGHAHADTLNFELSLFGTRVIVDSGTSCYGVSSERLRQRGTAAHNTVMINSKNSSEVWSGFRVARRAKPFNLEITNSKEATTTISCCHTGYQRLSGRPTHCRKWQFKDRSILITDTIAGTYREAIGRFHFHPDTEITINENGKSGLLTVNMENKVHWQVHGGNVTLVKTTYHPGFGVNTPIQCMEIMFNRAECSFQMRW